MGKRKKREKAAKKAADKAADKAAKKAAKLAKRHAKGCALASALGEGGSKKDWQKVAKLLDADCCTPAKRKCKNCRLLKELDPTPACE